MAKKESDAEANKFPETIYVTRQTNNQGDAIGLAVDYAVEDISDDEDTNLIGVYQLVRVERLRVTKELEPR